MPLRRPAPKVIFTNEAGVTLPPRLENLTNFLLRRTAAAAGCRFSSVSVAFVTPAAMRRLNRVHRRHDRVTDVLSFTYEPSPVVGELVLCLWQAERQARRQRHSLAAELGVLITHGLVHLAGHDHMKPAERRIMRALEQQVLQVKHQRP